MSIVACPRCRDEVTLPPKLSPNARVRCPLCRDEYILSEALAAMPPSLIVLDHGPDADVSGYGEPEYRVAGEPAMAGAASGGMAMGGAFDTAAPAGGAVSAAPRPMKAGARPRKKEGGAVGMIVQVVLGGVAALVLFQALAWWVMKQDPFDAGPMVSKYVPQIVPVQFHGKTKANGTGDGANLAQNATPPTPAPKPKSKKSKNETPAIDPGDSIVGLTPEAPKPLFDPLDPGAAPPVIPAEPTNTTPPLPTVEAPQPEQPKPMPEKPVDFTPPMPKPVDPNAKPPVNSFELTAAHAEAVVKREAFDQADQAGRRQAGQEMFEAAAALGKLAAAANLADPELEEKASELKQFSILLKDKVQFVNFFAIERLKAPEGADGIVLGGKIIDSRNVGDMTETTIEIPQRSGPVPVVVVSPKITTGDGPKIGDTTVILGRVVRDPKKDLPKYAGEAPLVIEAGQTTVIPAE